LGLLGKLIRAGIFKTLVGSNYIPETIMFAWNLKEGGFMSQ
jgi:hypothetical protein